MIVEVGSLNLVDFAMQGGNPRMGGLEIRPTNPPRVNPSPLRLWVAHWCGSLHPDRRPWRSRRWG